MGHGFAEIELSNPLQPELRPVRVKALADIGPLRVCIPEHVALQLGLEPVSELEVTVADGRKRKVPYAGPIRVALTAGSTSSEPSSSATRSSWGPFPRKTWTS